MKGLSLIMHWHCIRCLREGTRCVLDKVLKCTPQEYEEVAAKAVRAIESLEKRQVKHANSGGLAKMSNDALAGVFHTAIQAHRKLLKKEEVGESHQ